MSFFQDTEWYKDRMETQRRFEAGEISDTRRGLLNVAGSVEALYTPVELAMQGMFRMLPDKAQDVIRETAAYILQRIVENAPNELPTFYKGGPLGAAMEMAAAVPGTIKRAAKEAVSPRARASARAGVNQRLRDVVQKNDEISELYAKKASGDTLTKT